MPRRRRNKNRKGKNRGPLPKKQPAKTQQLIRNVRELKMNSGFLPSKTRAELAIPAAYNNTITNPGLEIVAARGMDSFRFKGRVPISFYGTYTSFGSQYALKPMNSSNWDGTPTNFLHISPVNLYAAQSRELLLSVPWAEYRYHKLKFEFSSLVPTNQVGQLIAGYTADGGAQGTAYFTGFFGGVTALPTNTAFAAYSSRCIDVTKDLPPGWFFSMPPSPSTIDTGSYTAPRTAFMGGLVLMNMQALATDANFGILYCDFDVELKGARSGFTLPLGAPLEEKEEQKEEPPKKGKTSKG